MVRIPDGIRRVLEGKGLHVFDTIVTILVLLAVTIWSGFTLASTNLTQTDDTTTVASPEEVSGGFNAPGTSTSSVVVYGSGTDAGVRLAASAGAPSTTEYTVGGAYTWTVPAGISSVKIELWGGGGDGGDGNGGGGGAYSKTNSYAVTEGGNYAVYVGAGGEDSYFVDSSTALAKGGQSTGSGGQAAQSIGDVKYSGDDGATGGIDGLGQYAGGGGYGAGSGGTGTGGAGGTGTDEYSGSPGTNGEQPGGGGGGGLAGQGLASGAGAHGQAILTYSVPVYSASGVYKSYVDGGTATPNWSTFALTKGSTAGGAGTIAIKIKTSASNVIPPTFNASGAACDFSVSANGSSGAKDLTTCTNLGTARYLWYEATLTTADTSASPLLEEVVVAIANTAPSAPSSLGPAARVNGSVTGDSTPDFSLTLSDSDTSDTVRYQMQIDDTADFSSPVVDFLSVLAAQGAQTFTVGQAAGGGVYVVGAEAQTLTDASYYWRARTADNAYATSSYATANGGSVAFIVDTTPPVITLSGSAAVSLTVGDAYTDAGATATDAVDGNLTASIVTTGSVDTATAGTYTLTYAVSDTVGNAATPVTRTVTVVAAQSGGSVSHSNSRSTPSAPAPVSTPAPEAGTPSVAPETPPTMQSVADPSDPADADTPAQESTESDVVDSVPSDRAAGESADLEPVGSGSSIRDAADTFVQKVVVPVQYAAEIGQHIAKETADVAAPVAAPVGLAAAATALAGGSVPASISVASVSLFRFGAAAAVYLLVTKPSLMSVGIVGLYILAGLMQYGGAGVGRAIWRAIHGNRK